MKYFRAVNQEDVTDVLYLSSSCDLDDEQVVAERTRINNYGYTLVECSEEEFEAMTQEQNDYILNVGQDRSNINPFDSAHTEAEAIQKAELYCEDWKCVEVVYMPQDNDDINEIIWSYYDLV
jgi:hypothetical protein